MKKRILTAIFIAVAAIAAVAVCVIIALTGIPNADGENSSPIIADGDGAHGNVNGHDKEQPDGGQPDNEPEDKPTGGDSDKGDTDGTDEDNISDNSTGDGDGDNPPQEPEHRHSAVHTAGTKPSCTAAGNAEYWFCAGCGKYFSDAGCENEINVDKLIIGPAGHTPVTDEAVAATCASAGLTEGSHCSVCGEILIAQTETPLKDHAFADGICAGCGQWQVSSGLDFEKISGGYAVSGIGACTAKNIRIPDIYEDEPVIKINETVFFGADISGIYVPASVTEIGEFAFSECAALTQVYIEDGLTVIGDSAFDGCVSLKTVRLPETLSELRSGVFGNCGSLEKIVIPASVKVIQPSAFENCDGLKRITLSKGIETIRLRAFAYCHDVEILFLGTPDEWDAIVKENDWISGDYTVGYIAQ